MKQTTQMRIKEKGVVISRQLKIAQSFGDRLIGLMFREKMEGFDALLIKECRSIHTCFMKYPIDVVFLNNDFIVKKIIRSIRPWRMTGIYFTSSQVLEVRAGELTPEIAIGDQLEVICIN